MPVVLVKEREKESVFVCVLAESIVNPQSACCGWCVCVLNCVCLYVCVCECAELCVCVCGCVCVC